VGKLTQDIDDQFAMAETARPIELRKLSDVMKSAVMKEPSARSVTMKVRVEPQDL
jgi:hypothetical protein